VCEKPACDEDLWLLGASDIQCRIRAPLVRSHHADDDKFGGASKKARPWMTTMAPWAGKETPGEASPENNAKGCESGCETIDVNCWPETRGADQVWSLQLWESWSFFTFRHGDHLHLSGGSGDAAIDLRPTTDPFPVSSLQWPVHWFHFFFSFEANASQNRINEWQVRPRERQPTASELCDWMRVPWLCRGLLHLKQLHSLSLPFFFNISSEMILLSPPFFYFVQTLRTFNQY
jgi:hypothetical protein